MATTEVVAPVRTAIGIGTLSFATIQFFCELGKANGRVIPLGVMAELSLPRLRGLGMIARTELDGDELEAVGYLGRGIIARPFQYLAQQFEKAWVEASPGKALEYLAARHPHSLHFSVPDPQEIPRQLLTGEPGSTLKADARAYLGITLDDRMLRLIEETNRVRQAEELIQLKAA